jgi:hypothetical protein
MPGAILLRKAADQSGLTAWLGTAVRKAGTSPALDRGIVLVSVAAAIALGATSMSDVAVLAHLAPLLGDAPSGSTVRRALDLAGGAAILDRIAGARAKLMSLTCRIAGITPRYIYAFSCMSLTVVAISNSALSFVAGACSPCRIFTADARGPVPSTRAQMFHFCTVAAPKRMLLSRVEE